MRRIVLSSCLAVVAVTGSVLADSTTNRLPDAASTTTNRLPEVVVTATRVATPLEEVGSAVTVISREEIVNSQARSLPDLLRESAGMNVVQSGGPGGQTSVFTRGLSSKETLFLIDGVRVGDPLMGPPTLANITPDQVERIEIVRGPQSTLYGSDAMGGVVNIITRKGTGPLAGSMTLEGGSYGTFNQLANISIATNKFNVAASFSHLYTDNQFPNTSFDQITFASTLGYQVCEKMALDTTIRFSSTVNGLNQNQPTAFPDLTDQLHDYNYFGRVGLKLDVSDTWQQTFFVVEKHEEAAEVGTVNPSNWRTDLAQIGWQNDVKLTDWNTLTAGLDWHLNHGVYSDPSGTVPFDKSTDDTAGYVQDQMTLFHRLTLTAGTRYEHNSQFGDAVTGHGAGVLRFDETGTRLKASGGSGFRAPTMADLYESNPNYSTVGNPNLKPEESTGWDVGVEQDIGSRVTSSVRYFENDIRNQITPYVFVAPNYTTVNIGRVRTDGIELDLDARPVTNLTCFVNYTWLIEAKDLVGDTLNSRIRRPEHSGNLGASYRFFNRFTAHTSLTLVGSRYDSGNSGIVRNSGYAKWNLGLADDICKYCQVFVRCENLTDEKYSEVLGYPALGRTVIGGATVKF